MTEGGRAEVRHSRMQYLLMICMGWCITAGKCLLAPARSVTFRGLEWDLANERVTVLEEKMRLIMGQLDRILSDGGSAAAKELQSIAGRVGALRPAVQLAPTNVLHKEAIHMVDRVAFDAGARCEMESCLKFWMVGLQSPGGLSMWKKPPGL